MCGTALLLACKTEYQSVPEDDELALEDENDDGVADDNEETT